ncbi:hypothetical protein FTO74_08630 [Granulicella sp. WH15]|uniref:hypothetical protein n=1 Tax=Granulicella sp. WH15 TaxID=2602070 RepID=UPI0013669349|nr:hypothetical protein [Granulicella sp. WH15]QHN03421.1 hypothetical protein FTO74_08630 [Granulicella sp. WH15]
MKAKKPTPKRIIWPPRMTPKRKRALALLQEWADKRIELEYSARAGVIFTGTLSELSLDERRTSFLFRNDFGVHAVLSTDLYDRIEVTEIGDLPINVGFFRQGDFSDGFSARPKDERAKPKRDLKRVCELFRHWERLDTMLMVNTGDGMRITVACGKVKELSDRFMFTIADTETIHLIAPDQSTSVHFESEGDEVSVMLYNDKSGMHFTVTNRLERPEDVINRFSALTTLIQ